MLRCLLLGALALASSPLLASPIAGTWQGPCETRSPRSVKFTYVISEADDNGTGTIAKTKIYYNDAACEVYGRTAHQTVPYVLSELTSEGYYLLDVHHRGNVLYDIVAISDDGEILSFGEKYTSDPEARPTSLSTTNRVFVRAAE